MSTLVVYFSRTGTTRQVAQMLAHSLNADLDEIQELRDRRGVRGYVRSVLDATLNRWVPVDAAGRDPTRYDLVVVGTPVWGWSLSAPVRSFLASHSRRLPRVAFFATMGGGGVRRVFRQMAEVAGAAPVATLALLQRDVERSKAASAVDAFVARLPRASAAPKSAAQRAS